MMFPARMKKGIAMRLKESIPPKVLTGITDSGIPRTSTAASEVMMKEMKIGSPRKTSMMRSAKIHRTSIMQASPF